MGKIKTIGFVVGLFALAAIVLGSSMHFSNQYLAKSEKEKSSTKACPKQKANYALVIENDRMTPSHISGARCDTLTISNNDTKQRIIAFGQHNNHKEYDQVIEKPLSANESFTVTLSETGSYIVHDHLQEEIKGTFTVE